jgi:PhoH-like ATPase
MQRRRERETPARADPRPATTKLFVLDTNVLMHDPTSLFRFEEHDVFLPMVVLEELDDHKKGMSEVSRNARQASRFLDEIVSQGGEIEKGYPLKVKSTGSEAGGCLFLQTHSVSVEIPDSVASKKADNVILGVAIHLKQKYPKREVVLVSKDINMRIKAHAVGIPAEDYFNDKVLEDTDLLYTGIMQLPQDFWDRHGKDMESWQEHGRTLYRIRGRWCRDDAEHVRLPRGRQAVPRHRQGTRGKTAVLQTLKDFSHHKNNVWGITRRNREQNFALNLLMDPESRLRHAAWGRRHRQDAAHARRGPDADPRLQGLQRDHHDARHRPRGRGHRLPAGHRGREDDAVDGRPRGQPRRAHAHRRRGGRLGAAGDRRTSSATASR